MLNCMVLLTPSPSNKNQLFLIQDDVDRFCPTSYRVEEKNILRVQKDYGPIVDASVTVT